MAEILALGISHYPPLTGHDDRMSAILRRMLQNPDLPAHLRTPEGWPAEMQTEWGDDQGTTAATAHRAKHRPIYLQAPDHVIAHPSQDVTPPARFAVLGWTDDETRRWLDNASSCSSCGG